jgi:hypothetical protein
MGFMEDGRSFGFSIAENKTQEPHKNNESALWLGGALTPLPPVKITHPRGLDSDWVIQDMEGMVDLTFTPKEKVHCVTNFIVAGSEHDSPLGLFNGMLMTSSEEEIPIRNVWGVCENVYMRV